MPTSDRNTTASYLDLAISEATARILDLEHDYALARLMLSEALTIAATAQQVAARERAQRLAMIDEFRAFRLRAMAGSLRTVQSERPTRRPAHLPLYSDRLTERPHA